MLKKNLFLMSAAVLVLAGAPAIAQEAAPTSGAPAGAQASAPAAAASATLQTGSTVYDTQGGTVGTIESVEGDFAVLSTGANKVRLPKSSFGTSDKGPVIAMTKSEVDAAAGGAKVDIAKVVTPGAKVTDTSGNSVGTIEEVKDQYALLATANNKVRLPISAFGAGDAGPVIGMTAAEIDAAAAAAGASAGADASTSTVTEQPAQ